MELKLQKKLAAAIKGCSPKKIKFDVAQLKEIKEAITKGDIRSLLKDKIIKKEQDTGISRFQAKKRKEQRKKGRMRGHGRREGTKNARLSQKRQWINRIRKQREFIKTLRDKDKVTKETYHTLYGRVKGGFFRSLRHLKMYMNEHNLFKK